ncbi:MAG: site-specific DNA-methyltransferase [Deltaproteobacteria bacterium]
MKALERFSDLLGKPYFEAENVVVFNSETINLMALLPSESISLIVTSPPYNIGKEYETVMDIPEYVEWTKAWTKEIPRVLTGTGAFWLNLGYVKFDDKAKALPLPYLVWDKIDLYLIQEIVWNYGAGVAGKKFLSPRNEKWLWYVKDSQNYTFNLDTIRDPDVKYPTQKKNGKLRCNTIGKNPSDVWQIAKVTSGTNRSSPERTPHPAQFPTDLINRIVLGFSNEDEIVLDPFLGSGSTAISCLQHNRKVIGFEIREDYCSVAAKRIKDFLYDKKLSDSQSVLNLVYG